MKDKERRNEGKIFRSFVFIGMIAIMLGNLFMITEYPFVYPGIATILKLIRYLGYMVIVVKILYDIFYLEDIIKQCCLLFLWY